MTLSADGWVTVVEVAAVLFGLGVTWALYHRPIARNPGDAPGGRG